MKKIFLVLTIIFLLLVGAIIAIPLLVKDDIVSYIKNETLNATLNFDEDIEISLLSSFPHLKIGINDLSIINKAPFEGDTLLDVKSIRLKVDIMSALSDAIQINSIDIIEPRINVLVRKDAQANYDITLPSDETVEEETSTDESSSSFKLQLESFNIQKAHINYYDTTLAAYAQIKNLNYSLNGAFDPNEMEVNMLTDIDAVDVWFDEIHYLNNVKTSFNAGMLIDLPNETYTFKENELQVNNVKLGFDGLIKMEGENFYLDLKYGLTRTEFKDLLSLVPSVFMAGYEELKADGKFMFDGDVKGTYSEDQLPAFNMNLGIENGSFKYPDLPTALNNTQLAVSINNPSGNLDDTVVDMKKLHFELDHEPFDAIALVKTPMSDPYLKTKVKGTIDLKRVSSLIPLEGINKLEGILQADFAADGNMSSIDNEQYDQFNASGAMLLQDFIYAASDLPAEVGISKCAFTFAPEAASLNEFDMTLGESDINMNGKITNYFGWLLRDDTLSGNLSLNSNYMNVNPWLEEDEAENTTTTETEEEEYELEAFEIPKNIHFSFSSSMKHLIYDTYDMTNFNGNLLVRNGILRLNNVGLEMLDGSMMVNGMYDSRDLKHPKTDFDFDMKNISIPGLYATFNTVKELMPLTQNLDGSVGGQVQLKTTLGNDLMPDLNTVNGKAKLIISKAQLKGNKAWALIAKTLKWDDDKDKLQLVDLKPSLKIINGRLYVDSTDFKIKGTDCVFSGSSGLDQTLDYTMIADLPANALKEQGGKLIEGILGKSVDIPIGDHIKMALDITGTSEDPKVKPRIISGDGSKSLKDNAKDLAKEKIEEAKATAIKKSKEQLLKEAAKLKDEAAALRAKAVQLKNEAAKLSKEGEKLKAEANNIRKEADKQKAEIENKFKNLPKIAREKAMIPVNAIFSKADKKLEESNKYFDLAKKPEQEADKLIKKADELEKQAEAKLQ